MSPKLTKEEDIQFSIAEIAEEAVAMAERGEDDYDESALEPDDAMEDVKSTKKQDERDKETKQEEVVAPQQIDEAGEDSDITLRSIVGGDILGSDWFRRQFLYIMLIGVLSILYVTNRYSYQHELIEQTKLKSRLEDRRKRALVSSSELTTFMRNRSILENLPDSTIRPTVDPFYYINPKEK
jgi:hypothetical protein